MRTTGPHPLRARELTTPHPEGLTTRLVPVEVDLKQQIFDVCSSLNNGHSPKGRLRQLCAKGRNRSRGRALRRAAWPWMDDGSVLPDDEGPEAYPQNRRSFSTVIARSRTASVGSAPDVAWRHLRRG